MAGAVPGLRRCAARLTLALLAAMAGHGASAITIELKDVASDRIERQRAAIDGRLPLPGTPDVSRLDERLAEAGLKSGAPALIRIFKETSELELWMEKGDRFVLFATYPICHWSGGLGPKLKEGDKQTPEGFYTITSRQLRHIGRWPRAINLGFPNAYDRAQKRSGSYILMHGGCSSVGCFAMTNPVMSEIHALTKAALGKGQRHVAVHVFPFRMTDAALAQHATSPWHEFWTTLQAGYTSFERTRRPPRISVCEGDYRVEDAAAKPEVASDASTEKRKGRKIRADMMIGAIRTSCPTPVVAKAEGEPSAPAPTTTATATTDRTPGAAQDPQPR